MYDLIYADDECLAVLKKEFPFGEFEDCSDEIHTERFSISLNSDIPEEENYISLEDYQVRLLASGYGEASLNLNLMKMTDKKTQAKYIRLIKKAVQLQKKMENQLK